jgi:hAT family C-terminal dimerisation region
MDSTATNRKAMRMLQDKHPILLVLPCAAHCLSLVIKHVDKHFEWVHKVFASCCALSEKIINSEKLRSVLHDHQKACYGSVRSIPAHAPTRFGSMVIVARAVANSEKAVRQFFLSDEWQAIVADPKVSAKIKALHAHVSAVGQDNLFKHLELVETLLGPVMDGIHRLEADQPMLSFMHDVLTNIYTVFETFELEHLEDEQLWKATKAAAKNSRSPPESITLTESFCNDLEFYRRPAVAAASVLDPLNWKLNALGMYHMPIGDMDEGERDDLRTILRRFSGEDVSRVASDKAVEEESALIAVQFGSPADKSSIANMQETRKVSHNGRDVEVVCSDHTVRLGWFVNQLSRKVSIAAKAVVRLLSMPVTACAAERNWSRWGLTYPPNRNRLGLESATKMVFIQSNDPETRLPRGFEAYVN